MNEEGQIVGHRWDGEILDPPLLHSEAGRLRRRDRARVVIQPLERHTIAALQLELAQVIPATAPDVEDAEVTIQPSDCPSDRPPPYPSRGCRPLRSLRLGIVIGWVDP